MLFRVFQNERTVRRYFGWACAGLLVTIGLCLPSPIRADAGYTSRPCGFDLNGDGVVGAPEDCSICSGQPLPIAQIYVDCQGGDDENGSGKPSAPYRSIQHALDVSPAGLQSVVCFKGVCNEQNLTPKQGGVPSAYTRDGFEFPAAPNMLVGWDANGNGDYPPHDPDDVAVLDGQNSAAWAIDNSVPVGYLELAHFTAQNYTDSSDGGFMKMAHSDGSASHIYLHDLSIQNINKGQPSTSSTVIVFNFFIGASLVQHVAITNSEILDYGGGYLARGAGDNDQGDNGPLRFQNLTVRAFGESGGTIAGIKLWDMITGIDVFDNYFDANSAAWAPDNGPTSAVHAANCSRNWNIRGNEFIDYKEALVIDPDIGDFCTARTMDNVVFDGNTVRNTYAWHSGSEMVQILPGSDSNRTVNNVSITNNVIMSTTPADACVWSNAGNNGAPEPGTIVIANNTCSMPIDRIAAITIGPLDGNLPAFPHQDYVINDNIITGLGAGQDNISMEYAPSNLSLDGNVYDPNGGFTAPGGVAANTFADWSAASGEGPASKVCTPLFVDLAAGDLHLSPADACAQGAGANLP